MVYDSLEDLPAVYKESIKEAVEIILSYNMEDLCSIVLFGSCSRLDVHVGSDIDIAVLTKTQIKDRHISGGIRSDLDNLYTGISGDAVLFYEESYESDYNRLARNIKSDGIVLWKDGVYTNDYKQLLRSCNGWL